MYISNLILYIFLHLNQIFKTSVGKMDSPMTLAFANNPPTPTDSRKRPRSPSVEWSEAEPETVELLVKCEASCTYCKRKQPIVEFLPAISNNTHRKRNEMEQSLNRFGEEMTASDCVTLLHELEGIRTNICQRCRSIRKKSEENPETMKGKCRAKWYKLKTKLAELGCVKCGSHCIHSITLEHTDPAEKKRDKNGYSVNLSDYVRWAFLGGPEAMQAEFDMPSTVPMCFNCQFMQPTHTAMKPKLDPDTLPTVKKVVYPAAYKKKRHLTERRKKQAYVDGKKLQVGECAECWMRVVPFGSAYAPGHSVYPHAFQWAHRSELDKGQSVGKIVNSSQSFKTAKPELDREMGRSRLLCQNCGKVETDKRKHAPGPSEEGN